MWKDGFNLLQSKISSGLIFKECVVTNQCIIINVPSSWSLKPNISLSSYSLVLICMSRSRESATKQSVTTRVDTQDNAVRPLLHFFGALSVFVLLICQRKETETEEGFLCHTYLPWTCIKVSKWSLCLHNMQYIFFFQQKRKKERKDALQLKADAYRRTVRLIHPVNWWFQILNHDT